MPTVPVKAAGWRIEPPVSVAVAPRHRCAATAAAEPPEEPPGTRCVPSMAPGSARAHVRALAPPGRHHRAEGAGLVRRAHGELVHVELAEHHRAVVPEVPRDGGFVGRIEVAEDVRAGGRDHAFGAEQILDAERDALERAGLALGDLLVRGLGHGERLLGRLEHIGVERPRLLDGGDMGLREFGGGEGLGLQAVAGLGDA